MIDQDTLDQHRLDDDGAPAAPDRTRSFCVWCWDRKRRPDGSEPDKGATNALRFATREEAEAYAGDLYSRWMGLDHYEVRETSDPVTYRWSNGAAISVELLGC